MLTPHFLRVNYLSKVVFFHLVAYNSFIIDKNVFYKIKHSAILACDDHSKSILKISFSFQEIIAISDIIRKIDSVLYNKNDFKKHEREYNLEHDIYRFYKYEFTDFAHEEMKSRYAHQELREIFLIAERRVKLIKIQMNS